MGACSLFGVFCALAMCLFFFFSSRRRHTRLQGDWSSDVCSSDLVKTCTFIKASCCVPQMKSLAGVAANTSPRVEIFSPCVATARSAVVPDLATLPSAFSTMLASPPRLLPGVVLALRQPPALVARSRVGAAVRHATRQILVVPSH